MNTTITYEEQQLMALYNGSGTRAGLIAELTDSAIGNLEAMTNADYAALDLTPDFDAEDEDAE